MQGVVQSLEQTVSQVHVSDWVDSLCEVHASWELSVSMSPVVLDTFHVPLVDHHHNLLFLGLVDLSEQFSVFIVDEDALEPWEENSSVLNIPVDQVLVKALFSPLRWLTVMKSYCVFMSFHCVVNESVVLKSFVKVVRDVHSCFVV